MTTATKPDYSIPKKWFETGLVGKADTIKELAEQMGIEAAQLEQTIAKMNEFATTGVDTEFHRGESDYDRYYADQTIKPNPCLAPISKGPFYAIRCEPGDFGTSGGLNTDIHARVLKDERGCRC